MDKFDILKISEHPEMLYAAAEWFHEKWRIPLEAYRDSMKEALSKSAVPEWYIAVANGSIIAGMGVIENDFHLRKDLTPNVCAVYTEERHRRRGLAGRLLNYVCGDMAARGIGTLYLLTDHSGFYERYGWEFFCMVQGDGEEEMSRMYMHRMKEN